VSNPFGSVASNDATLTVTADTSPRLFTQEGTDNAIAFDSVTMAPDPFPLNNPFNFSSDHRTRIMLFAANVQLKPGENSSAVTVQAEDSLNRVYPLLVEFVGTVPEFDWLTQINVRLADELANIDQVWVSITFRGATSNKAVIKLRQ
jgi:uncharacterized protein (TIGR03437 family)